MKSEKQRLHIQRLADNWRGGHHSEIAKEKLRQQRKLRIGSKSSNWRGGRILVGGYYYIHSPDHPNKTQDGYVCEHRLVVESSIGRLLERKEVVHHINGIKTDNRLENLVLVQSQSDHNKHHRRSRNKSGRFV